LAFVLAAGPRTQAEGFQVAQAAPGGGEKGEKAEKKKQEHKALPQRPHAAPPQRPAQPPHAAPAQRPAQPPQHAPAQRPAQPAPAQRPTQAPHPAPTQRPVQAPQPRAPERPAHVAPQQRAPERPAQTAPRPAAPEQHRPAEAPRRPGAPERRPAQTAPAQPQKPAQTTPATPQPQKPAQTAPAPQPQRPAQTAPAAQPPKPSQATPQAPQQRPAQTAPLAPPTQQRPTQAAPAPGQPARPAPAVAPAIAAPPPPQKPLDASRFIRKPGEAPTRTLRDLKQERHETREGDRTIIREGDRTIVREGNRTIIRHSEADRFAVGARAVHEEHRGNLTVSIVARPNGVRIINETDYEGHLVRRLRRERDGREIVIIDDSRFGPDRRDRRVFLDLPPPRIHIPRDRYIVELDEAPPERIYQTLIAPPVQAVDQVYSIGEVRYNAPLRALMPRVDLDVNFETGSWQITPDQIEKLDVIARDLKRAVDRNPREVFMIEGHTDAVGAEEDNLSLSDRRAESVAVALTEQFGVPPENLVTQGYGEQDLKVPTQGPERANRRVAIRRITPLIDQSAQR
jgi:outer membrane protein OmpA-like peptidoglycan-associated protein